MDTRFKKISTLVSDYSLGKFNRRLKLSAKQDYLDGIIFALNMLGEELNATTISRNYFTNIFHSVSDIIIVLDKALQITDTNKMLGYSLGHEPDDVLRSGLDKIMDPAQLPGLVKKASRLTLDRRSAVLEADLISASGGRLPFLITISAMYDEKNRKKGFLLVAKDYSYQKEVESMVRRMIIDTQEKERTRLAKDIHDSLGQQISAVKFYIGTCISLADDSEQRKKLVRSNEMLLTMIEEIRNICFAIMPRTLEDFGLVRTVRELAKKIGGSNKIDFDIREAKNFPGIEKAREIIIYRVIQEFISNTLKHAHASRIGIRFGYEEGNVRILLSDNGKGFSMDKVRKLSSGLGNMRSRVSACQGTINIESRKGEGTRMEICLPIK